MADDGGSGSGLAVAAAVGCQPAALKPDAVVLEMDATADGQPGVDAADAAEVETDQQAGSDAVDGAALPDGDALSDGGDGADAATDAATDVPAECTVDKDCAAKTGVCLIPLCIAGACKPDKAPDGSACSDGEPCTSGDHCAGGLCVGTDQCTGLAEQEVTTAELLDLQSFVDDEPGLETALGPLNRDSTGTSGELPTAQHPLLATVERRLQALLGLTNRLGGTLRMRRYGPGQGHPPHLDVYEIAGQQLLATAILCVHAPRVGGQTVFLDGGDGPLQVEHRPGQVVAWLNVRPDGQPMTSARHLGAQVLEGQKVILSLFFYGQSADLRGVAAGQGAPLQLRQQVRTVTAAQRQGSLRGFGRVLAIVDDGVPSSSDSPVGNVRWGTQGLWAGAVVAGLRARTVR